MISGAQINCTFSKSYILETCVLGMKQQALGQNISAMQFHWSKFKGRFKISFAMGNQCGKLDLEVAELGF